MKHFIYALSDGPFMKPPSRKLTFLAALAVTTVASVASVAAADPLAAGGSTSLSSTSLSADSSLGCTTVGEDRLADFDCTSGSEHLKGRLQYFVCKNGSGTLDFYYRIMNDSSSNVSVGALASVNWTSAPFTVDVNWRSDGLGSIYPKIATRSKDTSKITFMFDGGLGPIVPGSDSRYFFVRSTRTAYDASGSVTLAAGGMGCSIGSTYRPL